MSTPTDTTPRTLPPWLASSIIIIAGLALLYTAFLLPWQLRADLRELQVKHAELEGYAHTAARIHTETLKLHAECIKEVLRQQQDIVELMELMQTSQRATPRLSY